MHHFYSFFLLQKYHNYLHSFHKDQYMKQKSIHYISRPIQNYNGLDIYLLYYIELHQLPTNDHF